MPKTKTKALQAATLEPPNSLVPWEHNPRENEHVVDRVAASIQRFGFAAPIVARLADRRIIAGHTRHKAAIRLGLAAVPVRWLDISETEADALALADNRLGELADWDDGAVAKILQGLQEQEVEIDDLGWTPDELEELLDGLIDVAGHSRVPGGAGDGEAPKLRPAPGEATLLTGDCLHKLREVADGSIDALVTDPPYGLSAPPDIREVLTAWLSDEEYDHKAPGFMSEDWDSFVPGPKVWAEVYRVLKPGAYGVVFAGTRTADLMGIALRMAGFEVRDLVEWCYWCLDDETEILTDHGWARYSDAIVGRHALCFDVADGSYAWGRVEAQPVFDFEGTAYRLAGDRTEQLVTGGHRCVVERGGAFSFALARDLARQPETSVPVVEGLHGLLCSLPMPDTGTGGSESVMFQRVSGGPDLQRPQAQGPQARCVGATDVLGVRGGVRAAEGLGSGSPPDVLPAVQWQGKGQSTGETPEPRQGGVILGGHREAGGQDARPEQPGVEGRRHLGQPQRELPEDRATGQVPGEVLNHGENERVRAGAQAPGRGGARAAAHPVRGGAPRESRPDGQPAGEPGAVPVQQRSQAVRGARFTVADVVRVEPVAHRGKVWCVAVPTGAFVARRRGRVFVTGNSGFPKNTDLSKTLDKRKGNREEILQVCAWVREARDAAKITNKAIDQHFGLTGMASHWTSKRSQPLVCTAEQWPELLALLGAEPPPEVQEIADRVIRGKGQPGEAWFQRRTVGTVPAVGQERLGMPTSTPRSGSVSLTEAATEAARAAVGMGSALKPAHEPIWLIRKPFELSDMSTADNWLKHGVGALNIDATRFPAGDPMWPGPGERQVVGSYSQSRKPAAPIAAASGERRVILVTPHPAGRYPANLVHAKKPSQAEKQAGCEALPAKTGAEATKRKPGSKGLQNPRAGAGRTGSELRNWHKTVKPLRLMAWLVRLVCPPGGRVLDPFLGSGTTGAAAVAQGHQFTGIELRPEAMAICEQRIAYWAEVGIEDIVARDDGEEEPEPEEEPGA